MITDDHTLWLPTITHIDYRGGHTQWLPTITHNDYRRSHASHTITDGHTHNDYHTQWLPAVTRWPHNYRWSHTMIINGHAQSLLMITRSCCMQPHPHNDYRRSHARVACRLASRQICALKNLKNLKNASRHFQYLQMNTLDLPPPPPLPTKWLLMVFLKSQCCILRSLAIPLIWCETFRGNGNDNVTITSWCNCFVISSSCKMMYKRCYGWHKDVLFVSNVSTINAFVSEENNQFFIDISCGRSFLSSMWFSDGGLSPARFYSCPSDELFIFFSSQCYC